MAGNAAQLVFSEAAVEDNYTQNVRIIMKQLQR